MALQPLSLTAPIAGAALAPVIGHALVEEHSLFDEHELPLTAPMLASFFSEQVEEQSLFDEHELPLTAPMLASFFSEQVEEQLLLQLSPTAPMLAPFSAQQADLSGQHSVEQLSLPTAPGLVVLPVVAQPRSEQERRRAAMPETRIIGKTPWAV